MYPLFAAIVMIETSGAEAHGVLTRPKIMPIKKPPKRRYLIRCIMSEDLLIWPNTPQAYRPISILKIEAARYAQTGATEKKPPNLATINPKMEKLIITPKANKVAKA